MIHFTSSCDLVGPSILTSLALHRCIGPSVPSLAQALPSHAVPRFKASNLPFTLATGLSSQVMSWSSPPWSHDSMSCLTCNKLLHDTITCGLIPYVSHINTISPLKLSLNYQNQTRTFHQPLRSHGRVIWKSRIAPKRVHDLVRPVSAIGSLVRDCAYRVGKFVQPLQSLLNLFE
jgi:hypothetical protein